MCVKVDSGAAVIWRHLVSDTGDFVKAHKRASPVDKTPMSDQWVSSGVGDLSCHLLVLAPSSCKTQTCSHPADKTEGDRNKLFQQIRIGAL